MNDRFHPAAEAEFLEATGFYEQRVQGLGAALIDELEVTLALICEQPTLWSIEASPDIRRVVMQRFPFSIP